MKPPAPPAPPNVVLPKTPGASPAAVAVAAVAKKSLQETLAEILPDIERIARAVPTPNVLDSHLHGKQLQEIAAKLRQFVQEKK